MSNAVLFLPLICNIQYVYYLFAISCTTFQLLRDGCVRLFEKDNDQRNVTINELNVIYDILCLTLMRRQQYGLFLEVMYSCKLKLV